MKFSLAYSKSNSIPSRKSCVTKSGISLERLHSIRTSNLVPHAESSFRIFNLLTMTDPSLEDLQSRWNDLYKSHLPSLAKAKDAVQPKWPVQLDHCFARIVLDNAVGIDKPWNQVVKSPAYKNMLRDQLMDAIDLGEKVATGQVDLVELDERSLGFRGKRSKVGIKAEARAGSEQGKVRESGEKEAKVKEESDWKGGKRKATEPKTSDNTGKKRKRGDNGTVSSYFLPSPAPEDEDKKSDPPNPVSSPPPSTTKSTKSPNSTLTNPITNERYPNLPPEQLIANSTLTPFRKTVLRLLLQIPEGKWSTYQLLSDHLTASTGKNCSARAIGNAMRNNPFAPLVPCHRVLASGGNIGGFGGSWGEGGTWAWKKREMLRGEGVRFDGKGRAVGSGFVGFKD